VQETPYITEVTILSCKRQRGSYHLLPFC